MHLPAILNSLFVQTHLAIKVDSDSDQGKFENLHISMQLLRTFTYHSHGVSADRFLDFLKHHPHLFIRGPQPTSFERATSFNKQNIESLFNKLAEVMRRHSFGPDYIWNMDETVTTVHKSEKVVAQRGHKRMGCFIVHTCQLLV